ncbi:MAG: hypothetical protein ACREB8_16960 [Pseudolabrys sp.]
MPTSRYLAKLIGPVLLAIGLGLLLNTQQFRTMGEQFLSSYALIYLSGLLALPVGIAIVLAHNVWTPDWRAIITVLGWLAIIGGVARIVFPQFVVQIGIALFDLAAVPFLAGIGMIVVGALLGYFGYLRTA